MAREDQAFLREPPRDESLPFPESLCHACAAPPRYIRTVKATYLFCPVFKRYPPQPVFACERFTPKADNPPPGGSKG